MFKQIIIATVAMCATTEAINIEQKLQMREKIDSAINEYLDAETDANAEWGFLKNIVNIDRFFDSGVKA